MKRPSMPKKELFTHIVNVVTIALIVECFLCSFLAVRKYAREDSFDRIEEITTQMSHILTHSMGEYREKLTVFADILAANSENPDEQLRIYMENFCRTDDFSALCIHRRDGSFVPYGQLPNDLHHKSSFEEEVALLASHPDYVSEVIAEGEYAEDQYFHLAVPIVREVEENGARVQRTDGILFGYLTLDILPSILTTTAYDGECEIYIVDGDTGNFLMSSAADDPLGNIDVMSNHEAKPGYELLNMRNDIRNGQDGYYVWRALATGDWHYTYYMPTAINNWSIQLTIDEATAFAGYTEVSLTVFVVALLVIVLMVCHVLALMAQSGRVKQRDRAILRRTGYINDIQRALLNAHNDASFIEQALKRMADESKAETAMLLSFTDRRITNAYYWPSVDKNQAMNLLGRNLRDDFPVFYDHLAAGQSIFYTDADESLPLPKNTRLIFRSLEVSNVLLTPIVDTAGLLRGCLCAVNVKDKAPDPVVLESVTYDFYMAISNVENHTIIKNMGTMDYLTNIKNRNSYEAELGGYATMECDSLWCVFIDVNGLHEVNNTQGHKAGDALLCAVAEAVKKHFGTIYTYRLGGDEFVAFACDSTRESFEKKKKLITTELATRGYHVSVGFEGINRENGVFDIERLVSDAEAIMYREKWEFYQKNDIPSERGHFPPVLSYTEGESDEDI